jgi:hypothetical protein
MKHSNLNPNQLELNLNKIEFSFAESLTTREVRELICVVAKKKISSREILLQAKNGKLEIPHACGILIVAPSQRGKPGRLWRWDICLRPKL